MTPARPLNRTSPKAPGASGKGRPAVRRRFRPAGLIALSVRAAMDVNQRSISTPTADWMAIAAARAGRGLTALNQGGPAAGAGRRWQEAVSPPPREGRMRWRCVRPGASAACCPGHHGAMRRSHVSADLQAEMPFEGKLIRRMGVASQRQNKLMVVARWCRIARFAFTAFVQQGGEGEPPSEPVLTPQPAA